VLETPEPAARMAAVVAAAVLAGLGRFRLGLEELIEVKRAAGRLKDLEALAELVAIRESRS
jgi:hypothetical protein